MGGISRDKLLAYLWPESEPERAHHALSQLLYAIRRDLRTDALIVGADELRLNPELISSDLWEFERALDQGERQRAVALYWGPFLDGFHLPDALEFERWIEGERQRLAERASGARGPRVVRLAHGHVGVRAALQRPRALPAG